MADHLLLFLSTSSCAFPAILYTTTTGHLTHAWCRDESLRKSYPSSHLYRYIYKESRSMTNVHSFIHLFSNNLGGDQSTPLSNLTSKVKLLIPLQVPLSATAKHHKKKALVEQSHLNSKPLQKANITGSCCAVPLVTSYLILVLLVSGTHSL